MAGGEDPIIACTHKYTEKKYFNLDSKRTTKSHYVGSLLLNHILLFYYHFILDWYFLGVSFRRLSNPLDWQTLTEFFFFNSFWHHQGFFPY